MLFESTERMCVYVCECLPAVLSLMWLDEPDEGGGDKMCVYGMLPVQSA